MLLEAFVGLIFLRPSQLTVSANLTITTASLFHVASELAPLSKASWQHQLSSAFLFNFPSHFSMGFDQEPPI
jgi:hypothetical protein